VTCGIICSYVGICSYLLTGLKTTVNDLVIHLRKDMELMGCGSNIADLSKVLLHCEILWHSTVLKE
jgi:hypothetical protein